MNQEFKATRGKHGHTSRLGGKVIVTPTYVTWHSLRMRVRRGYCDMHERWKSFENFLEDMGERPVGKTIDRINNYLGYSKENCRWLTAKEQSANKRNNIIHNNEIASDASIRLGGNRNLVWSRLKNGWNITKAFTIPAGKYTKNSI